MSDIATEQNGRHLNGTFAAGNTLSRGNRGPARAFDYKRALLACVTPEKIREIEEVLFSEAKKGDVSAIRVWLEHCIGKPLQALEVSGKDGGAMDINVMADALVAALGGTSEARLKVADAFRRLADGQFPGPGEEAGPGLSDAGPGT